MTKIFDYKESELLELRKRNIIFAIVSFVLGFVIALVLLLVHNRENSTLLSIISIVCIFAFALTGLTFLFILNAPIPKLLELIKKEKNSLSNEYLIESIEEKTFSQNGLAFRKVTLISTKKEKNIF